MPKAYPTAEEVRAQHLRRLRQSTDLLGDSAAFPFLPSNGAYGPCAAARKFEGKAFRCDDAPLPPLPDCEHPDQCMCMFGAVVWESLEELGAEPRQPSPFGRFLRGLLAGWRSSGPDA